MKAKENLLIPLLKMWNSEAQKCTSGLMEGSREPLKDDQNTSRKTKPQMVC